MATTVCEKMFGQVYVGVQKSSDGLWANTEKNIKQYPFIWVDDWNSPTLGGRILFVGGYAIMVGYLK